MTHGEKLAKTLRTIADFVEHDEVVTVDFYFDALDFTAPHLSKLRLYAIVSAHASRRIAALTLE